MYAEEGHRIVGIPRQIPLLLYIGQLKKEKNLELLIEALAIAHAQHAQFHMVFVGSGPDTAHFKRMIDDLQLKSHVTFTGKITDREQIKALLAASSLFLFPSQYDTSALVLREAAAFSLPLLNTLGSSTAGVSTDNVNGFVAKNNAKDYGGRLVQLLGQPQLCKNVGLEANKTLYRNWSDVVDEVEQRYLELKAKGPKAKKKRSSSR
jgi:glycosyltransferase involved in cell wall biosynthesis